MQTAIVLAWLLLLATARSMMTDFFGDKSKGDGVFSFQQKPTPGSDSNFVKLKLRGNFQQDGEDDAGEDTKDATKQTPEEPKSRNVEVTEKSTDGKVC